MLCFLMLLENDRDVERISQMYETHRDMLLRVARTFFPRDATRSEDAVQNAFVSIAKNFQKFSQFSCQELQPYLVVTVKNACRDILRKEKKYAGWDEKSDVDRGLIPRTDDLEEGLRRAVELISSMPEKYRAVLELRLLDGLSYREIGARLGITEDTAAQRYGRGRKLVAEQLEKEGLGHYE